MVKKNVGEPPYNYKWGSITLVNDERSASSHITISYN